MLGQQMNPLSPLSFSLCSGHSLPEGTSHRWLRLRAGGTGLRQLSKKGVAKGTHVRLQAQAGEDAIRTNPQLMSARCVHPCVIGSDPVKLPPVLACQICNEVVVSFTMQAAHILDQRAVSAMWQHEDIHIRSHIVRVSLTFCVCVAVLRCVARLLRLC